MAYHLYEGLLVLLVTFLGMGIALFLTRKPPWTRIEKMLLAVTVICYLLDTIWWWRGLHYPWTDLLLQFKGHTLQITAFFVTALISFLVLIGMRGRSIMTR